MSHVPILKTSHFLCSFGGLSLEWESPARCRDPTLGEAEVDEEGLCCGGVISSVEARRIITFTASSGDQKMEGEPSLENTRRIAGYSKAKQICLRNSMEHIGEKAGSTLILHNAFSR